MVERALPAELRAGTKDSSRWAATTVTFTKRVRDRREMDGKRTYMAGGMAGSESGVSFNGTHDVVKMILRLAGPDYYSAKYFLALRFARLTAAPCSAFIGG